VGSAANEKEKLFMTLFFYYNYFLKKKQVQNLEKISVFLVLAKMITLRGDRKDFSRHFIFFCNYSG
jgi:hypothetical protein